MESTLPKYAPSILPLVIIPWCVLDIQNFSSISFEWKKCWFVSLWVLFVLQFIGETFFHQRVRGFASHQYKSIQCMVDYICQTGLTKWKLIRKDPWMSESLQNNRWSSGGVDYLFSISWNCSKWITIIYFTLWHESIYCHFNKKTSFKFLWLEFRFKSFLELHMHFKGFMCILICNLHAECSWCTWLMPNCVLI